MDSVLVMLIDKSSSMSTNSVGVRAGRNEFLRLMEIQFDATVKPAFVFWFLRPQPADGEVAALAHDG